MTESTVTCHRPATEINWAVHAWNAIWSPQPSSRHILIPPEGTHIPWSKRTCSLHDCREKTDPKAMRTHLKPLSYINKTSPWVSRFSPEDIKIREEIWNYFLHQVLYHLCTPLHLIVFLFSPILIMRHGDASWQTKCSVYPWLKPPHAKCQRNCQMPLSK